MTRPSGLKATSEGGALVAVPQFVRIIDVCRWLRISKPTLWRLRRRPDFPSPIAISDRVIGWPRAEIQAWLEARRRSGGR